MIKSLEILNFQSHEKTKLNFHDGVNVIVGRSDSGKTAIIRALRWASRNKPSGDSIRSNWGGVTNVIIKTEEGIIRRIKDKKDTYELNLHKQSDLVFHAFGTTVPEEIVTFLNLNEINIQYQLDTHFLLSKTSGEVAQYFNKVAKLDIIDKTTDNINKAIRDLKSDIKYKENDIKSKEEKLKEFDYLDKMEAEIEVLENIDNHLTSVKNKYRKLQELRTSIKVTETKIARTSQRLKMEKEVNVLLILYRDKKSVEKDRMLLNQAVSNINNTTVSLKNNEARHTRLLALFQKNFPNVCPLCGQTVKHKHGTDKIYTK
jgi:DNA repair exonuclease SbcCD ATPase subunit